MGETRGVHLLAAYLPSQGVVLAQMLIEDHTNKITQAHTLLQALVPSWNETPGKEKTREYAIAKKEFFMTQRRRFTAEDKVQAVLDLLSEGKSATEICRQHHLNPQLLSHWKSKFFDHAPRLFE